MTAQPATKLAPTLSANLAPNLAANLANLGFQTALPTQALRPYIRSYWHIKVADPLQERQEEFMHPTGGYGIAFNFGDPVQLDGRIVADPVFLDSANTVSRKMAFSGRHEMIGIRFLEGGAYPFFGLPLSELRNETAALDSLNTAELLQLQECLRESPNLRDRITLLEQWLVGRLALGVEQNPLIPGSLQMIKGSGRELAISTLAQELAISQRQLERLYNSQVGMTPKQYQQLLRVESARHVLSRSEQTTTTIGHNLGYYDQSHFIREFSAVVGMTPYAYQKRKQQDQDES